MEPFSSCVPPHQFPRPTTKYQALGANPTCHSQQPWVVLIAVLVLRPMVQGVFQACKPTPQRARKRNFSVLFLSCLHSRKVGIRKALPLVCPFSITCTCDAQTLVVCRFGAEAARLRWCVGSHTSKTKPSGEHTAGARTHLHFHHVRDGKRYLSKVNTYVLQTVSYHVCRCRETTCPRMWPAS